MPRPASLDDLGAQVLGCAKNRERDRRTPAHSLPALRLKRASRPAPTAVAITARPFRFTDPASLWALAILNGSSGLDQAQDHRLPNLARSIAAPAAGTGCGGASGARRSPLAAGAALSRKWELVSFLI